MYPWQWCSRDICGVFDWRSLQVFKGSDFRITYRSCHVKMKTPIGIHLPMQNLHFTNYSKNVSCDINFRRKRCYHYKWVGVWGFISWRSGVISDSLRTSVWQTALQRQWRAVSRRRVYTTWHSQSTNKVWPVSLTGVLSANKLSTFIYITGFPQTWHTSIVWLVSKMKTKADFMEFHWKSV